MAKKELQRKPSRQTTLQTKLAIIGALEGGMRQREVAIKFNLSVSTIFRIYANRVALGSTLQSRKRHIRLTNRLETMEKHLHQWYQQENLKKSNVENLEIDLIFKANRIARDLDIAPFQATHEWVKAFIKKYEAFSNNSSDLEEQAACGKAKDRTSQTPAGDKGRGQKREEEGTLKIFRTVKSKNRKKSLDTEPVSSEDDRMEIGIKSERLEKEVGESRKKNAHGEHSKKNCGKEQPSNDCFNFDIKERASNSKMEKQIKKEDDESSNDNKELQKVSRSEQRIKKETCHSFKSGETTESPEFKEPLDDYFENKSKIQSQSTRSPKSPETAKDIKPQQRCITPDKKVQEDEAGLSEFQKLMKRIRNFKPITEGRQSSVQEVNTSARSSKPEDIGHQENDDVRKTIDQPPALLDNTTGKEKQQDIKKKYKKHKGKMQLLLEDNTRKEYAIKSQVEEAIYKKINVETQPNLENTKKQLVVNSEEIAIKMQSRPTGATKKHFKRHTIPKNPEQPKKATSEKKEIKNHHGNLGLQDSEPFRYCFIEDGVEDSQLLTTKEFVMYLLEETKDGVINVHTTPGDAPRLQQLEQMVEETFAMDLLQVLEEQ